MDEDAGPIETLRRDYSDPENKSIYMHRSITAALVEVDGLRAALEAAKADAAKARDQARIMSQAETRVRKYAEEMAQKYKDLEAELAELKGTHEALEFQEAQVRRKRKRISDDYHDLVNASVGLFYASERVAEDDCEESRSVLAVARTELKHVLTEQDVLDVDEAHAPTLRPDDLPAVPEEVTLYLDDTRDSYLKGGLRDGAIEATIRHVRDLTEALRKS